MNITLLMVRESVQFAYGEEERGPSYEKDLVRAQFVAELNEQLGYPFSSIYVNVLVPVPGEGFHQIDVVVGSKEKGVVLAAIVESPQEYEQKREEHLQSLFMSAASLAKTERVGLLAYYTRWYEQGALRKRQIIIDYRTHPSYDAWQTAGFPLVNNLPSNTTKTSP